MPTDADFLAAIAAAPLDRLPKLVYADWLDENGDPRGELLRLDHALTENSPASERYWELHAKRAHLAAGLAPDWLSAVRVGADATPLLAHGWPDDVNARWRTLWTALERWTGQPPPDGVPSWTTLFLAPQPPGRMNPFPDAGPPDQQDDPTFIWLLPNQADETCYWCVRRSDARLPDPPVWRCKITEPILPPVGFTADESEPTWPSLSLFVLRQLIRRTHGTAGFVIADMIEPDEVRAELQRSLGEPVPFGPTLIHERNGIVAMVWPGAERSELLVSVRANAVSQIPPVLFGPWGHEGGEVSGVFIPELLRPATEPGVMPARHDRWQLAWRAGRRADEFNDPEVKKADDHLRLPWLLAAARLGNASACAGLGGIYSRDNGVTPDLAESFAWRHRGAVMGNPHAQYALGLIYTEGGYGASKDLVKAEEWLLRAVPHRGGEALSGLARLYERQGDLTRAADHLRQAAEAGYADAQCRWGEWLLDGKVGEPDPAAALEWYERAAEQGDGVAASQVGFIRSDGPAELRDPAESERWYRTAAEKGVATACLNLGLHFDGRSGYRIDHDEQAKWFLRAGELGHPNGYYNLAAMYQKGTGRPVDHAKAIEFFRKGEELGDLDCAESLGDVYSSDEYEGRDDAEAVRWYRKAAEGGVSTAQHCLAFHYRFGLGVEQSFAEALRWYQPAAADGIAIAHWHLAQMHHRGLSTPRDLNAAAGWCRSAIELGETRGYAVLGELYAEGLNGSPDMAAAVDAWNTGANGDEPDADCAYRLALATIQGHLPDKKQAIPLLVRALELGSVEARVQAGAMMLEENPDEQELAEVVERFEAGIAAYIPRASFELGRLYETGRGVPKDVNRAKELYRYAALHGWTAAQARLDSLSGTPLVARRAIPVAHPVIPVARRVDRKPNE